MMTMPRLVIDTNVALDLLHWKMHEGLRRRLDRRELLWLSDGECGAEFARVVAYPRFALDALAQTALIDEYGEYTELLRSTPTSDAETGPEYGIAAPASTAKSAARPALPQCRDPDDQKFLILAVHADADLLLTRDKALLELARRLLTVAPRLRIVNPAAEEMAGILPW